MASAGPCRLQAACRDIVPVDRRAGSRREDKVVGPGKVLPLPQSEQNGKQRFGYWQISITAFSALGSSIHRGATPC